MSQSETRSAKLKTLWGEVEQPRIRYRCNQCNHSLSLWKDSSLDGSNCTRLVLLRMQEFALHVPYRTPSQFMSTWGVEVGKSQVAEQSWQLEIKQYTLCHAQLELLAVQALAKIGKSQVTGLVRLPVTWMLEIDGSLVSTRVIGQDKKARVEYREVKTVVLYQKNTPSGRYHFEYFKEVLNNAMRTGISMRRRRGKPNSVQKLEAVRGLS